MFGGGSNSSGNIALTNSTVSLKTTTEVVYTSTNVGGEEKKKSLKQEKSQ